MSEKEPLPNQDPKEDARLGFEAEQEIRQRLAGILAPDGEYNPGFWALAMKAKQAHLEQELRQLRAERQAEYQDTQKRISLEEAGQ